MGKFELDVISKMVDNNLYIENYEELTKSLLDYLDKDCYRDLVILNKSDLKIVKEKRTELNKLLEQIKRTRIDTLAVLTGTFEAQLTALEKSIDFAQKDLGQKVKDYNNSIKIEQPVENTPTIYTLSIYSLDKKVLKELEKLAKEKGLKTEIKEK